MAVVEHGEEGDLCQPPLSPQPSFHIGRGGQESETAVKGDAFEWNGSFWPDLTNSSTSPASHRNIQPLYCLWWDRVTVSLTDHARHKTAVTASPWDSESGVI